MTHYLFSQHANKPRKPRFRFAKRLLELAATRPWLRPVILARNYGQSSALQAGFDRVQGRRVRESGILDFVEDVFVSEKMDSEKPNRKIFDAALRALGVENREHVLMVGDSLSSDVQGGVNAGLDTCWYNPNHAENPGKVVPTYEISSLEELYPLVMEPEELANVGLKNRRHQL